MGSAAVGDRREKRVVKGAEQGDDDPDDELFRLTVQVHRRGDPPIHRPEKKWHTWVYGGARNPLTG